LYFYSCSFICCIYTSYNLINVIVTTYPEKEPDCLSQQDPTANLCVVIPLAHLPHLIPPLLNVVIPVLKQCMQGFQIGFFHATFHYNKRLYPQKIGMIGNHHQETYLTLICCHTYHSITSLNSPLLNVVIPVLNQCMQRFQIVYSMLHSITIEDNTHYWWDKAQTV
jgi:hypothetical protein